MARIRVAWNKKAGKLARQIATGGRSSMCRGWSRVEMKKERTNDRGARFMPSPESCFGIELPARHNCTLEGWQCLYSTPSTPCFSRSTCLAFLFSFYRRSIHLLSSFSRILDTILSVNKQAHPSLGTSFN